MVCFLAALHIIFPSRCAIKEDKQEQQLGNNANLPRKNRIEKHLLKSSMVHSSRVLGKGYGSKVNSVFCVQAQKAPCLLPCYTPCGCPAIGLAGPRLGGYSSLVGQVFLKSGRDVIHVFLVQIVQLHLCIPFGNSRVIY